MKAIHKVAAALAAGLMLAAGSADAGDRKRLAGALDPAALYHNYCSVCHGDAGDGNSRAKNSLIPAPANFTDPALQHKLTPGYMAAVIRDGKPQTAMVGWKTQLSEGEITALAEYVRATFVAHAGDASIVRGRALYGHFCVRCHGVNGGDLASESARAELSRERIVATVAIGRRGAGMPAFAGELGAADLEALADYVQKSLQATRGNISGTSAHSGRDAAR